MKFYFYSNTNSLFDYLSRNMIANNAIVREKQGVKTIGTIVDELIFLTHKKLNRESRFLSNVTSYVAPITIEIEDSSFKSDSKVIAVKKQEENISLELTTYDKYNSDEYVGLFIFGNIPFSTVSAYYFDTEDEMISFERPSPDYWYPRDRFLLLPADFVDELKFDLKSEDVVQLCDVEEVNEKVRCAEKYRAMLLNGFNATQKWVYGKYMLNMDSFLQELTGVEESYISKYIPNYSKIKEQYNSENLLTMNIEGNKTMNKELFDFCVDYFSKWKYDNISDFSPVAFVDSLMNNFAGKDFYLEIEPILSKMKSLLQGDLINFETIIANIPESANILSAILFVLRDYDNFDYFMQSLYAYKFDIKLSRYALILWSALNGLRGVPGENYNKDNELLWNFIECKTEEFIKDYNNSLVSKNQEWCNGDVICGIPLYIEEIITFEEIFAMMSSVNSKELPNAAYKTVLDALKAFMGREYKKLENEYFTYSPEKVIEGLLKECLAYNRKITPNEMSSLIKILDNYKSKFKKATKEYDDEKLYYDWIKNEKNFRRVFSQNEEFWKKFYLARRGK